MIPQPAALAAAIARAWRAVVRAFTPAPGTRGSAGLADTTLFGGMSEQGRSTRRDSSQNDPWDPTGESTDFADPDPDQGRRGH